MARAPSAGLDLSEDEGLGTYINALIEGWPTDASDLASPLLWSPRPKERLDDPMAAIMEEAIGQPLQAKFARDADTAGMAWHRGPTASCDALATSLRANQPAFICTTSHGMTGIGESGQEIDRLGAPCRCGRRSAR